VQERSGGRLVLGLGTGDAGRGALDELRETVTDLRALLSGETIDRPGWPGALALDPGSPVPIWISALGPRGMRLAGEVADGVLLNWCSPERVTVARDRIAEGAAAAGRDPAGVAIGVYVRAWAGEDEVAGLRAVRAAVGQYASYRSYARQFREAGLGAETEAAAAAVRAGRPEEVPERLVRSVCAIGDDAAAHLEAYRSAGADLPIVYPVAGPDRTASIEATLLALAPEGRSRV
jgi:alkanesulfonate monooxygenase SsuD/methylene tetrahydromethanopterin reductase-like flavin-dependent oxidoreductase (luciferase family)